LASVDRETAPTWAFGPPGDTPVIVRQRLGFCCALGSCDRAASDSTLTPPRGQDKGRPARDGLVCAGKSATTPV
jgi:hypothetical protein